MKWQFVINFVFKTTFPPFALHALSNASELTSVRRVHHRHVVSTAVPSMRSDDALYFIIFEVLFYELVCELTILTLDVIHALLQNVINWLGHVAHGVNLRLSFRFPLLTMFNHSDESCSILNLDQSLFLFSPCTKSVIRRWWRQLNTFFHFICQFIFPLLFFQGC